MRFQFPFPAFAVLLFMIFLPSFYRLLINQTYIKMNTEIYWAKISIFLYNFYWNTLFLRLFSGLNRKIVQEIIYKEKITSISSQTKVQNIGFFVY